MAVGDTFIAATRTRGEETTQQAKRGPPSEETEKPSGPSGARLFLCLSIWDAAPRDYAARRGSLWPYLTVHDDAR